MRARAFGAVVFDAQGRVLLREPTGHYDRYVWTFAKGRPDPGETPEQCALRELREEAGVEGTIEAQLEGSFAGGTTDNRYFLVELTHDHGDFDRDETQSVRWATFDEAEGLICQTTNPAGQTRDLAVLRAAREALAALGRRYR